MEKLGVGWRKMDGLDLCPLTNISALIAAPKDLLGTKGFYRTDVEHQSFISSGPPSLT